MDATRDAIDRMKLLGFDMATVSGITWAMADLISRRRKKEIIKKATDEVALIHEPVCRRTCLPRRSAADA